MSHLLQTHHQGVCTLTLNKPEKRNAFDHFLIQDLHNALIQAIQDPDIRVILLNSTGKHFSAGADLNWMQRMSEAGYEENLKDAEQLALLLHTLFHCPKPTLAQMQGVAYGGGVGLLAACDIVIAEKGAQFCFSEVKLGLIPAVISPYVIQAIGPRQAKRFFMTGEVFSSELALKLSLIHEVVEPEELVERTSSLATDIAQWPPEAVKACKALVEQVGGETIDKKLMHTTAELIAHRRQSSEAKTLIDAFLVRHK